MNKPHINKIGLLCIRNKKLLVVYKPDIELYITPGGKIEPKETDQECLKREIFEELGCKVKNLVYFKTFKGINHDKFSTLCLKCYFGDLHGKIIPNNEITGYAWTNGNHPNLPLAPMIKKHIIPELIKRKILLTKKNDIKRNSKTRQFIKVIERHDFTKELKNFEYEVKFNIKNRNLSSLGCLKEIRKCFKDNPGFVLCKIKHGDKLITQVTFFRDNKTEYSFFKYHGAKMIKVKRHKIIKIAPFSIMKSSEQLLIDRKDFYEKLKELHHRFRKHKYLLLESKEISKRLMSPRIRRIGIMIKTRVKDFVLDIHDKRIYSIAVSFCYCKNKIQKQLEVEYSGYLPGFKNLKRNNEEQIIKGTLNLSKYIYDHASLSLESTIEKKFDFVKSNVQYVKKRLPN